MTERQWSGLALLGTLLAISGTFVAFYYAANPAQRDSTLASLAFVVAVVAALLAAVANVRLTRLRAMRHRAELQESERKLTQFFADEQARQREGADEQPNN